MWSNVRARERRYDVDDEQRRRLAEELRAVLSAVIADPAERIRIESELAKALALSPEQGRSALEAVFMSHRGVEAWIRDRADETPDRIANPVGGYTATLGTLFVCPEGDFDFVREKVSDRVPMCPTHNISLIPIEG
jgi:hypothetical protein